MGLAPRIASHVLALASIAHARRSHRRAHDKRPSRPALLRLLLVCLLVLGPASAAHAQDESRRVALLGLAPGTSLPAEAASLIDKLSAAATVPADADPEDEERELRTTLRSLSEALATEGWFSPRLRVAARSSEPPLYRLEIETGPRTEVSQVDIRFTGAIADPAWAGRRRALESEWSLPVGRPFEAAAWESAKARLLAATVAQDFAGARIAVSRAEVDAADARARLEVEIDSGPAYTLGELRIRGLSRYPESTVARYNPIAPGTAYSRSEIATFQQQLQDAPYFSSVVVRPDLDPEHPDRVPIAVDVVETKSRRVSVGVGYSSNTGAHLELAYRQALLGDRPWPLQTGLRVDQTGGYAYADLAFPPRSSEWRDSTGVLAEQSEIENQRVRRAAIGVATTKLFGTRDARNRELSFKLNFERENRSTPGTEPILNNVIAVTAKLISRQLDNLADPRRGYLLELETNAGMRQLAFDRGFVRGYARGLGFVPLGGSNVLVLRGEWGGVQAANPDNVPSQYLFRTGGATSVRGYDYQSLGVRQGSAVVGGSALAVASAELVHWFADWGVAGFVDAGDAAANFGALDPALGLGLGARLRTPAGPLAMDLAWGERTRQWRLQFAVTLAF